MATLQLCLCQSRLSVITGEPRGAQGEAAYRWKLQSCGVLTLECPRCRVSPLGARSRKKPSTNAHRQLERVRIPFQRPTQTGSDSENPQGCVRRGGLPSALRPKLAHLTKQEKQVGENVYPSLVHPVLFVPPVLSVLSLLLELASAPGVVPQGMASQKIDDLKASPNPAVRGPCQAPLVRDPAQHG